MISVAGGNNYKADSRVPDEIVKSEPMNVEYDENAKSEPINVEYDDDSVKAVCNDSLLASSPLKDDPSDDVQFALDKHGDTIECPSSFGDSGCQSDDNAESDAEVMEVDSPFFTRINVGSVAATSHLVRNKNVTADWRKFIGPERWRCQWLELRIKDLLSQVSKYDKGLALINHEKHLQLEMIKADSSNSELSQLNFSSYERNAMNRRKRKRYKDDADTSLYIKMNQIFSYYNHENRKSRTENEKGGVGNEFLVIDDFDNLDAEDTKSSITTLLESQGDDDLLAQYSLREILLEIECIQSRISNLQSHLSEAHNKIDHTQMSWKKKGSHDLHKKKKIGSPFGADEDETAVEILFGANNSLIDPHIESIWTESADDVLIDNEAAIEEEFWQVERVKRTNEIRSDPIKYTIDAQIVNLVNKKGPKSKKHGSAWKTKSKGKIRKTKRHA